MILCINEIYYSHITYGDLLFLNFRPTFSSLSHWLESLLVHLEVGMPLPSDVAYSILPKSLKTSAVIGAKETRLAR